MKRKFFLILLAFIFILPFQNNVLADVKVDGYFRSDGTYVQPHYRSDPDGNFDNNWSTEGNVNPYTGKPGTKERYSDPNVVYYEGKYYRIPEESSASNFYDYLWVGLIIFIPLWFLKAYISIKWEEKKKSRI